MDTTTGRSITPNHKQAAAQPHTTAHDKSTDPEGNSPETKLTTSNTAKKGRPKRQYTGHKPGPAKSPGSTSFRPAYGLAKIRPLSRDRQTDGTQKNAPGTFGPFSFCFPSPALRSCRSLNRKEDRQVRKTHAMFGPSLGQNTVQQSKIKRGLNTSSKKAEP